MGWLQKTPDFCAILEETIAKNLIQQAQAAIKIVATRIH
jgi:hypothetical protein